MIKSNLIAALAGINDAEIVLFRLPDGTLLAPASIDIQQDEPPIHALIVTDAVTKAAFDRIKDERQAARDAAAQAAADRVREEEAKVAAAAQAAADREAELQARIDQAVAAALATREGS